MKHKNRTPADLAQAVWAELSKKGIAAPSQSALVELFETLYYASLRTEELSRISFHMVYLDPTNPDPEPPNRITKDRWRVVQLTETIPFSIQNLIKLAHASDARTSSFAIYHDEQKNLFVWGFVDQGSTFSDYMNYESEQGAPRPGLFQASILGPGQLVAFMEMKKVGELKINVLLTSAMDVFGAGPIREALEPGISSYLSAIEATVPIVKLKSRQHWRTTLVSTWLQTLSRLLLRMQRYRHGGAILITPDTTLCGLNVKYELPYDRLRSALEEQGSLRIDRTYFSDEIWRDFIETDSDTMPVGLYLDETIAQDNLIANRRELAGTIWFLSLLTRVDGLLLLNKQLEAQGFGVEITFSEEPREIYLAGNRSGTNRALTRINYNHFGTRHRSMMRYCSQIPASVGFVVSQDGDVRAMTRVGDAVLIWENIKLQLPTFLARKRDTA